MCRNRILFRAAAVLMAVFLCLPAALAQSAETSAEWKPVEQALGRSGAVQPGAVFKVSMPRSDLKVRVDGTPIKPGLALGSWVAFKKTGSRSLVLGDLVLTEGEVQPVMERLQRGGVQQTALHNHLLNESPRVLYMHIKGRGDAVKLAETIRAALVLTRTPDSSPPPEPQKAPLGLDQSQIEQILGHKGAVHAGILQVAVPRAEKITVEGMEVPPAMGVASAMNFQSTGDGRAASTGDFVLLGSEVNPVIRALRDHGIAVTALHSHMLDEEPRLFFLHFWANSDALTVARGLRAALDETNSRK